MADPDPWEGNHAPRIQPGRRHRVRLPGGPIPDAAAVRQVTVEGLAAEAELILDVDEAGRLLGFEVIGARAGLPAELLDGTAPTG